MTIDLLVLGLDDVLFETHAAHFESCNHAFEKCGLSHQWSVEQYRRAALAHGGANAIRSVVEKSGAVIGRSNAAALSDEKNRLFHDLACQGRMTPNRGCMNLINEALEDGSKIAIVTDLPAQTAAVLLEQAFNDRLTDMFATIASGVSFDSPSDNNAYHLVLRTIGADPWRSVAIESFTSALLEAQRAGLWTLATTPHADDRDSVIGSDAWCPHLRARKQSSAMANLVEGRQGQIISFEMLDAMKNASRVSPSFARATTAAWA
ncbi:MAG: hypothetical protein A3I66_12000 [Burkholderiales bacterium RIFCSPLOWO2_02_FULL_57_36]|nr:MAG: hypothetical protein A3I66_12000 [Burkholderiales bacterium RIFCSPLOWO2_02_FULL_57_36]